MSDLNEEFLNDVDGDYPDVAEEDEEALLQDDGDVLDLVPEEEFNDTLDDSRINSSEQEEKKSERHKFASERQKITAPEASFEEATDQVPVNNNPQTFKKQLPKRGGLNTRGAIQGKKSYNRNYNHAGKNKTVLINPRFKGTVHVNNNDPFLARLAWDSNQALTQQQNHANQWLPGLAPMGMGPPMQPTHLIQPFQHTGPLQPNQNMPEPHMQHMQMMQPPGQQLQFIPPQQTSYMPQPLPPGVQQQPPMQGSNQWPVHMQGPTPENNAFMHNNYPSSPIIINTSQPPPQLPPLNMQQMYNQQNYQPNLNFVVPNRRRFINNNPGANMNWNKYNKPGLIMKQHKRKDVGYNFMQNNKKFIHDRLGPVQQSQIKVKTIKGDNRIPVVKEVRVTNVTTVKIEDDEETKDLRLKIEEQKRKREAVLQWKEQRRLENLKLVAGPENTGQEISEVQKFNMNMMKTQNKPTTIGLPYQQTFKVKKQNNNIVITNGYSKKVTKYQKNSKNINEQSVVTVKPPEERNVVDPEADLQLDEKHLSNFLADRKVLSKDDSLMTTRKVVIKNISTSTGDKKIIQICKTIGEMQKLHRDKNKREATITFKSVASAHAFFKKYQRHMLDLSMIEVSLCPMSESD